MTLKADRLVFSPSCIGVWIETWAQRWQGTNSIIKTTPHAYTEHRASWAGLHCQTHWDSASAYWLAELVVYLCPWLAVPITLRVNVPNQHCTSYRPRFIEKNHAWVDSIRLWEWMNDGHPTAFHYPFLCMEGCVSELCLRATQQRSTTVNTMTQHLYTPPVFPGIRTWDAEALPFWPGARAAQETSTAHRAIVNATIVVSSGWMDHGPQLIHRTVTVL